MAMASSLPLIPTKNYKRERQTGTKESHRGEKVRWKWGMIIWIRGVEGGGWKEPKKKDRDREKDKKGQQHVEIIIPLRIHNQKKQHTGANVS